MAGKREGYKVDDSDRVRLSNLRYLVFALLGVLLLRLLFMQWQYGEPIPYSEFLRELKVENVKEVIILDSQIQGVFQHPLADGRTQFVTTRVDDELSRQLSQHNVKFSGIIQSTFLRDVLGWLVPT